MLTFLQLFILIYLFFYMFPYPLNELPLMGDLLMYYDEGVALLSIWSGEKLLGLDKVERSAMTGSGDTTFDYVKMFASLIFTLLATCIAFTISAVRKNSKKFGDFIHIYARYFLAIFLFNYGLAKFYEGQFLFPDFSRLDQKIGDSSPMGLLWTFMGYSKAYTVFSGICEVVGGVLLLFRRTSVLGALISFLVMLNVVMLNFAYDVPVKLFSTHLALISVFIFSTNIKNLFRFFFLNETIRLKSEPIELQNRWLKSGRIIIKLICLFGFPSWFLYLGLSYRREEASHHLNGAYTTEVFVKNNDTIVPAENDSTAWKKFSITGAYTKIIFKNEMKKFFVTQIDSSLQSIRLTSFPDSAETWKLKYHFDARKKFVLSGLFRSDRINATFNVTKPEDYELLRRKFNWINEQPYNR